MNFLCAFFLIIESMGDKSDSCVKWTSSAFLVLSTQQGNNVFVCALNRDLQFQGIKFHQSMLGAQPVSQAKSHLLVSRYVVDYNLWKSTSSCNQ